MPLRGRKREREAITSGDKLLRRMPVVVMGGVAGLDIWGYILVQVIQEN